MSAELDSLIEAYLDSVLGDDARERLESSLLESTEARARFWELAKYHGRIREAVATVAGREVEPALTVTPVVPSPPRRKRWAVAMAIAAGLLVAAAGVVVYVMSAHDDGQRGGSIEPIATVIDISADGHLVVGEALAMSGRDYAAEPITLDAGSAEFQLVSGASVQLRGTTRMRLHSAMMASVERGATSFRCPPRAKGFTVIVPGNVRIVDLGTAFDVIVDDDGRTRVLVTEGRVRLIDPRENAPTLDLIANQTATVAPDGVIARADPFLFGVPLGNLFDDAPGTPLLEAMTTDTYQAIAEPGGLGIERVRRGGDEPGVVQTIAPGIAVDLTALGWNDLNAGRAPSNDAWGPVGHGAGIRVSGVAHDGDLEREDDGVGLHANMLVTFDLDAIRKAGGLDRERLTRFVADAAGLSDEAVDRGSVNLAVIVCDEHGPIAAAGAPLHVRLETTNGKHRLVGIGPAAALGAMELSLAPTARWLTLICASDDGQINTDHGAFIGARLE